MSQEYFPGAGSAAGLPPSNGHSNSPSTPNPQVRNALRPSYMTVGTGSASTSAAGLIAMLDDDSGYGGSIAGDGAAENSIWHGGLMEDMPTPSHTPVVPGEYNEACKCAFKHIPVRLNSQLAIELIKRDNIVENEKKILASHVHHLHFNQNRMALGRSINRTIESLQDLQQMNSQWPAHYPSVQQPQSLDSDRNVPRPGIHHSRSSIGAQELNAPEGSRPSGPRRAFTSCGEASSSAESSTAAENRPAPEPRLLTPQIAQEFSILKLDLKLGAMSQAELVHSMERKSIASLLDGKIRQSIRHLTALRDRIEDTSSKVLVTGDLNAGKSTFCNALLRRKILPEDQQPCTSIFCEVLDARENAGMEEVHAIYKDAIYNRNDESTYDLFSLADLERIVVDSDTYTQCKVYVKDIRSIDESLLNNGVVDISIIDAPGLNKDSLKTTAVFARQEEIDVVVFVVSAANHFTLSAKDFLLNAAHEKAYIFIVVNGFDNIRDRNRCQRMILQQVNNLSPRTFKESAELVHFVSSNAVPVTPAGRAFGRLGGGGGDADPSDDGPGDGDDDEDSTKKKTDPEDSPKKDKGKEREKVRDFEELEQALRRFVLEKRSRSKLAPAKTYLLNVLSDLNALATVNRDVAQSELDRVTRELRELEPVFEQSKKARAEVSEEIDRTIEETCTEVYSYSRTLLSATISLTAEEDLGVEYTGMLGAFQYAEKIKIAMLTKISDAVSKCELYARDCAVNGVSSVKDLGVLHLGDDYADMTFRSDMMFRRKRDALARQVDVNVEFSDFFDLTGIWERQEKVAGTGMAMTVVGVLGGRLIGGVGWVDGALGAARLVGSRNLRRLIVPGMILAVIATSTYLVSLIPTSLPRRLNRKISARLAALDYTHTNCTRISSEVRKVLRIPADKLRVGLQQSVESLVQKREETGKVRAESEVARKYFGNLVRESQELHRNVSRVDLEGPTSTLS
ncbi:MAG: mitofusin [Trizodia sp. TS-e1964]|nr:MAG: mitofusin [Trizodia sp. TS-e1964]